MAAITLVAALVAAVLSAGHRFFFCAPMAQVSAVACCDRAGHGASADAERASSAPAVRADHDACCHPFHAKDPGRAVGLTPDRVADAPLVAITPAVTHLTPNGAPAAVTHARVRVARDGPERPSPNEYRIFLRVSTT